MNDPVFQLQADIWGRISSYPFFSDIPVILNEKGIIASDIEQALKVFTAKSGKTGAAVVVDRPSRSVNKPEPSGPQFLANIPVVVVEFPITNRTSAGTNKSIEAITSEVMALIHSWRPNPSVGQIYCAPDSVLPIVGNDKMIASQLLFQTHMRFASPQKVATPVISVSGTFLSITTVTPDSSIYYTTDGSFPWAGNPNASLFGVTFLVAQTGQIIVTQNGDPLILAQPQEVSAGTYVRAAAYHQSKQGSDVAATTIL
jgi:hypothetical protein